MIQINEIMKSLAIYLSCVVMFIIQIFLVSCEKEYVLIERTVNAVWSSDDSEILKIVSIYETDAPEENYYFAPSGKNWKYRFEKCTPDLAECVVVGHSDDIDQGGILEYVPVYWLAKAERICTINPFTKAVLKNMQGQEELLELPAEISNVVFRATDSEYSAIDIAPSPNEDVIAVFFQAVYITSANYTDITHDKALFLDYDSDFVIIEVDSVPERPINTNSGNISKETNTYSLY